MATSALETVADYVSDVRTLLQDVIAPYRYDDPSLLVALNVTLLETRRLRADLFVFKHHEAVPAFGPNVDDTEVDIEPPFRLAVAFGMAAHALARDQEDIQDARSATFMKVFNDLLLGTRQTPIAQEAQ